MTECRNELLSSWLRGKAYTRLCCSHFVACTARCAGGSSWQATWGDKLQSRMASSKAAPTRKRSSNQQDTAGTQVHPRRMHALPQRTKCTTTKDMTTTDSASVGNMTLGRPFLGMECLSLIPNARERSGEMNVPIDLPWKTDRVRNPIRQTQSAHHRMVDNL